MAGLQLHAPLSGEAVNKRRIVVTGMGVVTSLGHDVKELYAQLLEVGDFPEGDSPDPASAAGAADVTSAGLDDARSRPGVENSRRKFLFCSCARLTFRLPSRSGVAIWRLDV